MPFRIAWILLACHVVGPLVSTAVVAGEKGPCLKDSPVNGTSASVTRLLSDS
jgi:hypothetical protein